MKYSLSLCMFLISLGSVAWGQTHPDQAKSLLLKRHQEFIAVTSRGDAEQMAKLVTADYMITGTDGHCSDRTAALAAVKANAGAKVEMKESDVQARLLHNSGVVIGLITWKAGDASGQVRFTEVWVKQKGHWLLSIAQATAVQIKT